ncbi:MAG: GNAT family N-acetyltransferase [Pseudomonadota bacterium]
MIGEHLYGFREMIRLRAATANELEIFDQMDRQPHARRFVLQTGIDQHRKNFRDPLITYLVVEDDSETLCGYFILVFEPENDSVEFRRILIDQSKRGIGQTAISLMESYCRKTWSASRIWLDVFEDNEVGCHIYPKLGYTFFGETDFEGRALKLYEKQLS